MDLKWNIGNCGTDCGGSGLVEQCRCSMCATSCAAARYELAFSTLPGGCTYGPIDYEFDGGQCGYEQVGNAPINGGPYTLGGGASGSMATFINGFVQIRLTRDPDGLLLARFYLVPEDGDGSNCNQRWIYDPAQEPAPPYWYSMAATCQTIDPDPNNTYFKPVTTDVASDLVETYFPPGSGNCCPCEPCGIFYDPINRLDSADPGDLWTEVSGDWYTESAGLRSDDAGAIILANASAPGGVEMRTVIVPHNGDAGDYNLILGYVDSDNYFRVCWTFSGNLESTASDTLKLYQMAAGVESELTLTAELTQEEYDGGPGWVLIGCINEARTHLTGYVRSTNDVPVLLSSAQISAAAVGDLAGLGEITVASGGYRSPALNTVSADCQACVAYSRCMHEGTPSPCLGVVLPSELQLTLPGGWTNYSPGGNCACPQFSALSVVVEFGVPGNFGSLNIPAGIECLYGFTWTAQGTNPDYFGCTTFRVKRLEVFLWWEAVTPTTIRWRAKLILQTDNNAVSDTAEWGSDPFAFEAWDCQTDWTLPKLAIANEHPGDPAFLPPHPLCAGAMGTPLLVEVL